MARDEDVDAAAAHWLARLHADSCSNTDREHFREWLASDPRHALAFEELTAAWDTLGRVTWPAPSVETPGPRLTRRRVLGGVAASLIGVGSFAGWSAAYAGVYETAVGEQRSVVLPDGTRAVLDTDTRIRFRDSGDTSEIRLYRGRASFVARTQETKLLCVRVGDARILTNRSRFDVECVDERLGRVVVTGGRLKIVDQTARVQTRYVDGGQEAMAGEGAPKPLDAPALARATAWQSGRLIFSDDTLATAVAAMNRYSARKLACLDAQVAAVRISGTFRAGDNDGFSKSLSLMIPVEIVQTDAGIGLKHRSGL